MDVINELNQKRKIWKETLNRWYNNLISDNELIKTSQQLNSPKIREFCVNRIKELTKDEWKICLTFARLESNINPFAVGDLWIKEDINLKRNQKGSWGMFQIYQPIHKGWVNFERIKLPDISYQILIWKAMWEDLKRRYPTLELRVMRYNGTGPQTTQYLQKWLKIYESIKNNF
jgi:hypothetical protein